MARIRNHKLVAFALFAAVLLIPAAASAIGAYNAAASAASLADASSADDPNVLVSILARIGVRVGDTTLDSPEIQAAEALPATTRNVPLALGGRDASHKVDSSRVAPTSLAGANLDLDLAVTDGKTAHYGATSAAVADTAPESETAAVTLWAAIAALGAAGALAWFWPHVKKLAVLVIPLYARITRDEVFDNDVRERIFNIVNADPGVSATDLASRAAVSWGTTMYHLDVLEQNRVVTSMKDGRYRRYFVNGADLASTKAEVAVLKNDRTAAVARIVAETPGSTQKEISRATGMTPQALHWHMARLSEAGLVRKVREGRVVRHFTAADA